MQLFVDITGWLGAVLLLAAYGLVSTKRLEGNSYRFQALNLIGGALLGINAGYHGALPSFVVNVIWIIIGVAAILHRRRTPL